MNCATYCRVSTEDQAAQGYSLDSQARELRDLARRKGYAIVAELSDDGISGATLDRPALTKLRDGVRAGTYGVVLVHAPDRLARKLALQLLLMDEITKAGARVEFLTTPAEDSAEGRLLLNISGVISEFEREKIRERTNRGKFQKARQGLIVTPGNNPFGYRAVPVPAGQKQNRLQVYEPEAATVRLIYALVVDERRSVRGVMKELNRRGIPASRGRGWASTQVRRVLTDPRYTGVAHYGRKQVLRDGKTYRIRDVAEWIAIPIPAIVTTERFAQARAQLERNRAVLVGRPAAFVYLLKSLLVCATCGYRYVGGSTSDHGRPPRRRYKHDGDRAAGACARRFYFSADAIEGSVRDTIAAAIRDPEVLRHGVEQYETRRGATDVELRSAVAHLQKQVTKVRQDERRLIDLVVDDREQGEIVQGKLRDLASRRSALSEQLRVAEVKVAAHGGGNRLDAIERLCAQARRGLAHLTDDGWRRLLVEIVDQVRVLPDRNLEIHGLLPDPELRRLSALA